MSLSSLCPVCTRLSLCTLPGAHSTGLTPLFVNGELQAQAIHLLVVVCRLFTSWLLDCCLVLVPKCVHRPFAALLSFSCQCCCGSFVDEVFIHQ